MILMKEYVSLKTAAMKMGKIFTVIIELLLRGKMLPWVIPCQIIQGMSPLPYGLFLKFLPVVSMIEI